MKLKKKRLHRGYLFGSHWSICKVDEDTARATWNSR